MILQDLFSLVGASIAIPGGGAFISLCPWVNKRVGPFLHPYFPLTKVNSMRAGTFLC